jgi:hypothetical protein
MITPAASAAALQARLMELINAAWATQAIAAACEYDLPERMGHGERSAADLAGEMGVDRDALNRLLRALTTLQVCTEVGVQRFTLGPLGHLLRRDHERSLRQWALLNGGVLWERWATLGARLRERSIDDRGDGSVQRFLRLASNEREAALFHGAMTELSRRVVDSLVDSLSVPPGALVVDVGGGSGELLAGVLARHPGARGMLLDLSHALEHAPPVLRHHGVEDRCALVEGSFFDGVPPDADLYLLKSVLHDWSDAPAGRILARCREAMSAGARLIVVERPMPERLAATPEHRSIARSDLNMLVGLDGRERTLAQYKTLFAQTGLVVRQMHELASGFSAIEVVRG